MKEYKIYLLECNVNGQKYVGVTSTSLKKRWANGIGYRNQPIIYQDIVKYGWDSFSHKQIDSAYTYKDSRDKEREYIQLYNTLFPNGYNVINGESGEITSLPHDTIIFMDENGKILREYARVSDVDKNLTINQARQLRMSLRQSFEQLMPKYLYGGFWGFKECYPMLLSNLEKANSVRNGGEHCGIPKRVEKINDAGLVVATFASQRDATRQTVGAKKTTLQSHIKSGKKYLGFYWRYLE